MLQAVLSRNWVFIPSRSKRFFSSPQRQEQLLGSPSTDPMGTGGSLLGVKWQEYEAGHLPTSNAKVKNGGTVPPLSHISSWPGAYLNKHGENFTFLSYLDHRQIVMQSHI
jgi:hypothetical protein